MRPSQNTATIRRTAKIATFCELLETEVSDAEGWPQLRCLLDPARLDDAAALLAEGIARRRIGTNARLHALWQSRRRAASGGSVDARDRQLFASGLLQNVGTPDQPGPLEQLHGLVAEAIWFEVVSEVDAGLGVPLRVEGHGWSATCRTSTGPPRGPGTTPREARHGRSFGPRCALRRSPSISSSAQRLRSLTSSALSSELRPSASPRSMRSLRTQFPRVPAPIPRSRAISTTGLRVFRTIRTAPALNSGSYLRRVCDIAPPHRRCLHDFGGYPTTNPLELLI